MRGQIHKLATGAGKTTVMAMVIAWQTINAAHHGVSDKFKNGFLVCTPGITIKDRLQILLPNDTESYYKSRQLVPVDYLPLLGQARIVITNYHAFMPRSVLELACEKMNDAIVKDAVARNPETFVSAQSPRPRRP